MKYIKVITVAFLFILSMVFLARDVVIAEEAGSPSIGWVGLWNEEMVEWAENGNRTVKKIWKIQAYRSPINTSEKIGEILIAVEPGSPFVASFRDNKGEIRNFEPDLYNEDWGYGPFFHQTVLERKEDWIKIPVRSLDMPLWINPKDNIKHLDIITVTEGVVYMLGGESIVIIKKEGNTVFFRIEQPSDMWCDVGTPPELNAGEVKKIKIEQLYDSDKHLTVDIKYKRGC